MKTVCTSGYFNPLHRGHVRLISEARKLGDRLIVIVNNDHQVRLKGSVPFMDEMERLEIVQALRDVDHAVLSIDEDSTVCKTLARICPDIFAKGGDSVPGNVPEAKLVEVVFGVGGDKIQSSSWLKATKP